MLQIKTFVFNPYQENTYLIIDEHKNCLIVDPGMHNYIEEKQFSDYIETEGLTPIALVNTHGHIDHVLGNKYVAETYGLTPQFHEGELPLIIQVQNYAPQMGIRYEPSPIPETFLTEQDTLTIGDETIRFILAPGHSPAHLCLYSEKYKFLIGGDVLFRGSIGRTDLPGGNHQQLLDSIANKIYTLPEDIIVYPGHGPSTTIKEEKLSNPFIRG
ncbi:MBL fold metallo-hydrolase [Sphingobacterium sp. DK4209]|uniref:MBL fold metallo-hydrolase n=1 Tax=Sphingobacterium zhuxiongii TaxID=2662364 RepID=A0A5Q0QER2_9SPHI|nr:MULTISPECIES: MBL fold metallo-hydrolase [unclassified Sphingobacterium]MVZ66810.1 MBL fold metallo-hydrolase [Sphingobacterium sp. DK4209]QGA28043.1 MBL fold metallo-hydrolase [Sphingobacterium sp. dk4302]